LCFVALLCASCAPTFAASPVAQRIRATPEPTGNGSVTVTFATPKPAPPKVLAVGPVVRPEPPATADLTSFRHLGTWVDVFDYTNDPSTILPLVAQMPGVGVHTLYLETARSNSTGDIAYPASLAAALDAAKARGLHVVAWYPPDFTNVALDVRRSLAAIHFRTARGNTFDAFASDIEYTQGVPDAAVRSARTVQYSQALRAAVGTSYALGGIVIPPTSLQINPQRWPNFPWHSVAPLYDVFMPMNYWTAHARTAATATDLTQRNDALTRALTGKPVHNIGGLGADADPTQVAAYVQAAMSSGSLGGGLYDFLTTGSNLWSVLRRFNS
jgi:hypothetical protein